MVYPQAATRQVAPSAISHQRPVMTTATSPAAQAGGEQAARLSGRIHSGSDQPPRSRGVTASSGVRAAYTIGIIVEIIHSNLQTDRHHGAQHRNDRKPRPRKRTIPQHITSIMLFQQSSRKSWARPQATQSLPPPTGGNADQNRGKTQRQRLRASATNPNRHSHERHSRITLTIRLPAAYPHSRFTT